MKPVLLITWSAFLTMACNDSTKKTVERTEIAGDSIIPNADSFVSNIASAADTVPQNIQIDSVIHLDFAPGNVSVTVKGHVDKKGAPVICYLPVTIGKKLTASVVPDNKKATLRFSHIYFPDGKSDGPFGNTLKYGIKQKGTYKIYIGPNKMAGDPVSSDFTLTVKVE
jgi:hypothetical protein